MEFIIVLVLLSWIVSAVVSAGKKKNQQQQQHRRTVDFREERSPAQKNAWNGGFGFGTANPFADAFQWLQGDAVQADPEPIKDAEYEYAEGECYDEQHQHDVYAEETVKAADVSVSDIGHTIMASAVTAPAASAPVVSSQSTTPSLRPPAFGGERSDVVNGIIWSEILTRPQERRMRGRAMYR